MATEGKAIGKRTRDDREHLIRCTICGDWFDMRELSEVVDHLHGQEIEEEPTIQ